MQGAVLAEGDHVVHALAYSLGPRQRGHDASVADDLKPNTKRPSAQGDRSSFSTMGRGSNATRACPQRKQPCL